MSFKGATAALPSLGEDTVVDGDQALSNRVSFRHDTAPSSAQHVGVRSRRSIRGRRSVASLIVTGSDSSLFHSATSNLILIPAADKRSERFGKIKISDRAVHVAFVILYLLQIIGSGFFLHWISTSGWNRKTTISRVTSAIFLCK